MVANIEEVLQRGEALSGESSICSRVIKKKKKSAFALHSSSSPSSSSHSTRLQGQQLVQPVEEIQERRQIPEHPLHLRQAGSRGHLFHHAHRLHSLLVALSDERGGGDEEGGRKVEDEPCAACGSSEAFTFDEQQDPCFLRRLYRHTVPLLCPHLVHKWVSDLKLNDVRMLCFIIIIPYNTLEVAPHFRVNE